MLPAWSRGPHPPIENISDTARWVAFFRALESERPDPIFRDPYARGLAGERGETIARRMPGGARWGWPMVVRTAVMDELILDCIQHHGASIVLNLAAGLDTRPYRLPLPSTLRWIEVDLPEILVYKQGALEREQPACRLERIALDLTDREERGALLERVGMFRRPVLVMSEGLLIYLGDEMVAQLAKDLYRQRWFRWWLFDLGSPRLLQMLGRRWGPHVAAGNAPFRFGPAAGVEFFKPLGWRAVDYRSIWEESRRLRREMPLAWVWRSIARLGPARLREELHRLSGVVLTERF